MTIRWLFVLVAFTCGLARAQDVPPPPRPQDTGPSLDTTLKFLADKINDEGRVGYTAFVTDTSQPGVEWSNKFTAAVSNLAADAKACRISFHWRTEVNGSSADDKDYDIDLKDVRTIVVMPQEQNQKQIDALRGHSAWSSRIEPNIFTLIVRRAKGIENVFLFSDEGMAGRVAKAMQHAVELCVGGNKEPF